MKDTSDYQPRHRGTGIVRRTLGLTLASLTIAVIGVWY